MARAAIRVGFGIALILIVGAIMVWFSDIPQPYTLRPMDAYRAQADGHGLIGMCDTGGWVNVRLREPLGARMLIDGATGQIATEVVTLYP